MIATIEADDAWCPPTFTPSTLGRMWLAWWIIQLESHSALRVSASISLDPVRRHSAVHRRPLLPCAIRLRLVAAAISAYFGARMAVSRRVAQILGARMVKSANIDIWCQSTARSSGPCRRTGG